MTCPNRNTDEYKKLLKEFDSIVYTDNIILSWQKLNASESVPSVAQAKAFIEDSALANSIATENVEKAIINNLLAKGLVVKYRGLHIINGYSGRPGVYDKDTIKKNVEKIKDYLKTNGLTNVVSITPTDKTFRVDLDYNRLHTLKDNIPSKDSARSVVILDHLSQLFPKVTYEILSVKQAKAIYDEIKAPNKVSFSKINSFVYKGKVILINSRVNNDVAIEEMLHPFVTALQQDNKELFSNLLKSAQRNFPVLRQQINDAYRIKNLDNDDRDNELVTQALARHFRKDYEDSPTPTFLQRVLEFIKWFGDVINKIHLRITGKNITIHKRDLAFYNYDQALYEQELKDGGIPDNDVNKNVDVKHASIVFNPRNININATLTDIAKLINTKDIIIDFDIKDNRIKYSLSNDKQKIVDRALSQSNATQKAIINNLFHIASESQTEVNELVAGKPSSFTDGVLLFFDKASHTYYDAASGEVYTSATTAINGGLTNEEDVRLNIDIGNDFDAILEALVSGSDLNDVELVKLNKEQAKMAHETMNVFISTLRAEGYVFLSQVILHDKDTKIAGTADLLAISPQGRIRIIDLKTSKHKYGTIAQDKYNKLWPLKEESLLKQKGLATELSNKAKHNIQINLYKRMLENMGYNVSQDDTSATTYHIWVEITGKDKDQVFTGNFGFDNITRHPASANMSQVDGLIPLNVNKEFKNALEDDMFDNVDPFIAEDDDFLSDIDAEPLDPNEPLNGSSVDYRVLYENLQAYKVNTVKKIEAIERSTSYIKMDKYYQNELETLIHIVSEITSVLDTGYSETGENTAEFYTRIVRESIKSIDDFKKFIEKNDYKELTYISRLRHFNDYLDAFDGLTYIPEEHVLKPAQLSLLLTLSNKIKELKGTQTEKGLLRTAVEDYVKINILSRSNYQFAPGELEKLMLEAKDLSTADTYLRDASTSPDTLIAIMDKILKIQVMKVLDSTERRATETRALASILNKLTGSNLPKDIFGYMLEFDDQGNFTGQYVTKIGKQYYDLKNQLYQDLKNEDGEVMKYYEISDTKNASPEELAFNKRLYYLKTKVADFYRAETIGEDGKVQDGEYHKYKDTFKEERDKVQVFNPVGEHGYWEFKPGVSDLEKEKFRQKYMDLILVKVMDKINGQPTGKTFDAQMWVPKKKYSEVRLTSKTINPKYENIINDKSALGIARKNFYDHFMREYGLMLDNLPMDVRDSMLGKAPLVTDKLFSALEKKPPIITRMFAGIKRSIEDFGSTHQFKRVVLDHNNNVVDSIPIYYTGDTKKQQIIDKLERELKALHDQKELGKLTIDEYNEQKSIIKGKLKAEKAKPDKSEISMDMAESLIKFSAMAENYRIMTSAEDTLLAFVDVIEGRTYVDSDNKIVRLGKKGLSKVSEVVGKPKNDVPANTIIRAKKFMKMVFYDSDNITRSTMDKLADKLITYSSLSYVAFNPFGNINNYAMGRINNTIEIIGGRFISRSSMIRARGIKDLDLIPSLVSRVGRVAKKHKGIIGLNSGRYDEYKPLTKAEALVDEFRMMDSAADIRESTEDIKYKSYYNLGGFAKEMGYILQDAAEYDVQTEIGIGVLLDTIMINPSTNEELSLYDAYDFDNATQSAKLKPGFTQIRLKSGRVEKFTRLHVYDIRNRIREINKQIHGNYAKADRMLIESYAWGRLLAQFHKWVAPALRARFQGEYYDENLGWLQGRYMSFLAFMNYFFKRVFTLKKDINELTRNKSIMEGFKASYGFKGDGSQNDERIQNKIYNIYRTTGELSIILSIWLLKELLLHVWDDDDDDAMFVKKLKNFSIYQSDRMYKELSLFIPTAAGLQQMHQFVGSPIATARTLGEIGEALEKSIALTYYGPKYAITKDPADWFDNPDVFYQNRPNKGKLKVAKEWADAVPILYSMNKWKNMAKRQDFYIK